MLFLKYLLIAGSVGLFAGALLVVVEDLSKLLGRLRAEKAAPQIPAWRSIRWPAAGRLAAAAWAPLLLALAVVVVPAGFAGVRVSQISGTLPATLYPGTHFVVPLVQRVKTFNIRDRVYATAAVENPKQRAAPSSSARA